MNKRLDTMVLVSLFLFATVTVWILKLNSTVSTILYLAAPSIYLLSRHSGLRKQILLFSLPLGLFLAVFLEYFARYNRVWVANSPLPRIFDNLSLESFIWWPSWVVLVVASYTLLIDQKQKEINKNFRWSIIILGVSILAFILWLIIGSPKVQYAYIKLFALPLIAPIIYILFRKPHIVSHILKLSLIFMVFSVVYEVIGLKLSHWTYPGEYIGKVYIFGSSLPVEELILWIVLGSASIISCYEIFFDNQSKIYDIFLNINNFLQSKIRWLKR